MFLKVNRSKVAITDSEGRWSLHLSDEEISDTIEVRYLGYRNAYVAVAEFAPNVDHTLSREINIRKIKSRLPLQISDCNCLAMGI